jgi:methyltransferase (TIGR00027 family)
MNTDRASRTAEQMALSRAIEARRPRTQRVCDDRLAERFLGRRYRWVVAAPPLRVAFPLIVERMFAGHHGYVLARTRYLDDFLLASLTPDVGQIVILGAGFDSRAYRFADRLANRRVFEVDHPATSTIKREKVAAILRDVPANVSFVPVDFDRDRLGDALARAGFRTDVATIVLWEGTVPYLSASGVDDTLEFVASSCPAGSRLIFDYVVSSVLDGTCEFRGAANEYARMKQTPEPFVFGIAPENVASFLAARGFRDVHDIGGDELRARCFPRDRRETYVKPWWRIVHAVVRGDAARRA